MKRIHFLSNTRKTTLYSIIGFLIGMAFPIIATLVEMIMLGFPQTIDMFILVQLSTPLLWFIDLAPITIAFLLFLTGKKEDEYIQLTNYLQEDLNNWVAEIINQKEFFESLFHNIPSPVVILDNQHNIEAINPAFENLFGYSSDEILKNKLDPLIADDAFIDEAIRITQLVKNGDSMEEIGFRKCKDNHLVEVEIKAVPVNINGTQKHMLGIYKDVSERQKLERELQQAVEKLELLATIDPLTGLLNRRAITDFANGELERAKRGNHNMCIAMVDVDRLKQINDEFGHLAGDMAIKKIGKIIRKNCRIYDRVGRWGGDEFMIVISNIECAKALSISERINKEINETPLDIGREGVIHLNVSIGVTCTDVGDNPYLTINDLFIQADKALYKAKESGRNQVRVNNPKHYSKE